MQIVKSSAEIITDIDGKEMLKRIERAGRTCYKSEDRITKASAKIFVENIIKNGHESVLEHENITVKIICDRAIANEFVRHRLASYSQESTRYCRYSDGITVVQPYGLQANRRKVWIDAAERAEAAYFKMLEEGASAEIARCVLPLCLKTELIMTANLREWRHILKLRTAKSAHPNMRIIAIPLLNEFKGKIPGVFDDIDADDAILSWYNGYCREGI